MLRLDSTKDRIKDLEENKGLIDEIYVLDNKVVEGNTRLCAFRRLSKKYPDDDRWKFIKARILHESVNDEELFYILGTFHIKGKTEWDAYEKAAYINKMIKFLNKSPDDVAKQMRIQKKTLEAMLKAYEVMSDKFLKQSNASNNGTRDELKKYSYFEAFFLQKELAKRAEESPDFVDEFIDWVKDDKLKRAQNVRELPKVLGNKKAYKTFIDTEGNTAFEEAIYVLYEHKPEKVDRFYKKVREFHDLIQGSELVKVRAEISENKNKKSEIQKCFKQFRRFIKDLGLEV